MSHQLFFILIFIIYIFFPFVYYVYLFWLLILINSGGLVAGEAEKFMREGKFIACLFLQGLLNCVKHLCYIVR